jgi:hypothetical protein
MATTTTTTTALKLLPELWSAGLLYETTEEKVVTREFSSPPGGAKKIGQQLHIPKVKRIAATGGGAYATGLTYTANTEEEITVDPVQVYGGVEIQRAVYNRMDTSPESVYRKMIMFGIAEYLDQNGASLASSLATNVKGSGLANIDKGLMLDCLQALATSAQREFKVGEDPWYFKVHTSQIKNMMNQFDFTADNVRGDGTKPLVNGWVVKVLGAIVNESGNVYQAGGVTHNLGYLPTAFVEAFNEEPVIIEPQPIELAVRIIGYGEFGQSEAFDEFAVDCQTVG